MHVVYIGTENCRVVLTETMKKNRIEAMHDCTFEIIKTAKTVDFYYCLI